MPNWKKVIVSGSSPHFNEITASGNISVSATSTGSFGRLEVVDSIGVGGGHAMFNAWNTPINVKGTSWTQIMVETTAANRAAGYRINTNGTDWYMNAGGSTLANVPNSWYLWNETVNAAALVVNNSNNLGIGTTSPTEKLTVAGDISASGDFHGLNGTLTLGGNISGSATSTGSFGFIEASNILFELDDNGDIMPV
jgi:hypothetical protein